MPETHETVYFDARLTPNRSLSAGAVRVTMAVAVLASLLSGFYFLQAGAAPVIGFFGLDLVLLGLAFRFVHRHQAQETRVRVTAHTVHLHHRDGRGREKLASLPTAFVRVDAAQAPQGPGGVRLSLSDRSYLVGAFLTLAERESLARALSGAIRQARVGR